MDSEDPAAGVKVMATGVLAAWREGLMLTVDFSAICGRLNESAGVALLEGDFASASVLLGLAAQFASTAEGRQTLLDRAQEAVVLGEGEIRATNPTTH